MDLDTGNVMNMVELALSQIGALAVAYFFSFVGAIIILIVGYILANAIGRWVYSGMKRFHTFDETLCKFLSKVARYTVLILVGITVLAQFGVQTASILAALGAAGLAIGLALQGTLQNIAAGIMLLVLKPFRVGEYVDAGGIAGTVEEIGLFATEMTRFDGLYILAPNSQLWGAAVINYSRNGRRRNDITIGIGYDDDITLAQQTLIDLANADGRVLADPAPATFVAALGDWTVNVTLRYWTATSDFWQTSLDLTKAGKLAFDQHGISMPSPQRDVHIYTDGKGTAEQPALPLPAPDNGPRKTSS
jgi:small conductance mechanosensitive channel